MLYVTAEKLDFRVIELYGLNLESAKFNINQNVRAVSGRYCFKNSSEAPTRNA